jgi:hypothetical protein
VPREPGPESTYAQALGEVITLAAQLRPLVVASMSGDAWAAAKQPCLDECARADFAARHDVAHYHVTGDAVAPGAAFELETAQGAVSGYSDVKLGSAPEITVPVAGTYRYHLQGSAHAASTASPLTLSAGIYVGGVQRAVISAVGGSADPAEYVGVGVAQSLFVPGEAPTIEIDGVLTVNNASAVPALFFRSAKCSGARCRSRALAAVAARQRGPRFVELALQHGDRPAPRRSARRVACAPAWPTSSSGAVRGSARVLVLVRRRLP